MTTPIKPPGGPPGAPPTEGAEGAREVRGGESFREALSTDAVDAGPDAERAGPAAKADGVQAIADDLAAGRIDRDAAVERLLERALASGAASALTPERRQALEQFLRQSLAEDPSLVALTEDLDRGR